MVTFVLLIIGGLNWGLEAIGHNYNIVAKLGDGPANFIYLLVGVSAIYEAVTHKKNCRHCGSGQGM